MGIHGGLFQRAGELVRHMEAAATSDLGVRAARHRELQREILNLAYPARMAEHEIGSVVRGEIDPWVLSEDCVVVKISAWSTHRNALSFWSQAAR
jgi:hypothetical protein